ncbi:MAG: bis(5'-nucleosyl)-tetraphosphatase (symmetrical) YqeK [Clostridia bacterium]|nr:bis(5'-nucleosyl)-tetraphosphatase (symmetrical) YqeK [Clostridia bacterium]
MLSEQEMLNRLKATQKESRFRHTLGVAKEAVRLAPRYGVDKQKAYVAALLHDCAKNFDETRFKEIANEYGVTLDEFAQKEKALIHAYLGAAVAYKDYGVKDAEILDAIYYHTTARANMPPLEKLIYIADMIEPGRTMPQANEIRRLVDVDLDSAIIYAIDCSIKHVIRKGRLIHPDSILARNYLIEMRESSDERNG